MSKTHKQEPSEHRNQVVREMIIERIGQNSAGRMRDRRDRRPNDFRNLWKNKQQEDW